MLDEKVAKYCTLKLVGLDTDSEQQELDNMEKWGPLVGSYDEMRTQTERAPIGKDWGGEFPLNPQFWQILDKHFTVGQIKEHFFGHVDASKDPRWDYANNPFYFQQQMIIQQQQQMVQQQQMAQEQMQAQKDQEKAQPQGKPSEGNKGGDEVTSGVDQLLGLMSKSEEAFSANKKKLRAHHAAVVDKVMEEWRKESERSLAEIADLVQKGRKK